MNTATPRCCVLTGVSAAGFQPHALHSGERVWVEKNCYADVWIELLNALELEPAAMLPFTLGADFEGDHWTFFKPPLSDLRALYEGLGDGVMVFTPEGIIEFANPAAERIFGFPTGALTGKPVSLLVPRELRDANLRASERFAVSGKSDLVGRRGMVFPAVRRDGTKMQIEFSLSEMQQASGTRLVGVPGDSR